MKYDHLPKGPGVYGIRNKVNCKLYIGCSIHIRMRCREHIWELKNRKHGNDFLQKSYNVHGDVNFEVICIEECPKDKIYLYEDKWAKILKVHNEEYGYNLTPTDPNGKVGTLAESTRKKMSEKQTGRKLSPEHIENVRRAVKGRKMPREVVERLRLLQKGRRKTEKEKLNMSIAAKKKFETYQHPQLGKKRDPKVVKRIADKIRGFRHSEETKKKMSESTKGYKRSKECEEKRVKTFQENWKNRRLAEGNPKCTKVEVKISKCDKDGKVIKIYKTALEAGKDNGVSFSCISKAYIKNIKAAGFYWKKEIIKTYESN